MFVKYLAASISSFIILKSLQQLGTYDSSHDSMTGSVMRMTVEITLKDNYHDEKNQHRKKCGNNCIILSHAGLSGIRL